MKLSVTKKAIGQAAAIASRMATGKIAASRCVRLEATADGLRIDASDGEIAVRYDAAGEVRKPGVAGVSAAANNAGVARFTPASVACADSTTASAANTLAAIQLPRAIRSARSASVKSAAS